MCKADGHSDHPLQSRQPSQSTWGEFDDGDGPKSWPLYAMYSKVSQEDDDKMIERSQKYVDGTLIFVSPILASI